MPDETPEPTPPVIEVAPPPPEQPTPKWDALRERVREAKARLQKTD